MEFFRTIFQSLFEDTTITTIFLKNHISNIFLVEFDTFFAIFNNKGFENWKTKPWKVFSSIKGIVFKKYLLLKGLFF